MADAKRIRSGTPSRAEEETKVAVTRRRRWGGGRTWEEERDEPPCPRQTWPGFLTMRPAQGRHGVAQTGPFFLIQQASGQPLDETATTMILCAKGKGSTHSRRFRRCIGRFPARHLSVKSRRYPKCCSKEVVCRQTDMDGCAQLTTSNDVGDVEQSTAAQ